MKLLDCYKKIVIPKGTYSYGKAQFTFTQNTVLLKNRKTFSWYTDARFIVETPIYGKLFSNTIYSDEINHLPWKPHETI